MRLVEKYPKLFDRLEEKDLQLRHLLNVDENYEDYDSEEFEFDFEEYNYIVYIAEPIQKVLTEEGLRALVERFEKEDCFENFIASQEDLYGIKSSKTQEEMVETILSAVEEVIR